MMRSKVLLLYPDPIGFSGQRAASELIGELLGDDERFEFERLALPGFPRGRSGILDRIRYLIRLLGAFFRALFLVFFGGIDVLHANMSQTRFGLLREGVVVWIFRLVRPRTRLVVSLHGSDFMAWSVDGSTFRIFRNFVRLASAITVLGPNQKAHLEGLLQVKGKVRILPNTCELDAIGIEELDKKHRCDETPVSVLHLSTLMEAKGWVTTVEGLGIVGEEAKGTICGLMTSGDGQNRFGELKDAEEWLETHVEEGWLQWVRGARGEEKAKLFREAEIFVFPSTYGTEAQPLVLIEAMASGCAIITSKVGEIGWMVDESSAAFLSDDPSATEVAEAILSLARDRERRVSMARSGHERFAARFSQASYRRKWAELLDHSAGPNVTAVPN